LACDGTGYVPQPRVGMSPGPPDRRESQRRLNVADPGAVPRAVKTAEIRGFAASSLTRPRPGGEDRPNRMGRLHVFAGWWPRPSLFEAGMLTSQGQYDASEPFEGRPTGWRIAAER